MIKKPIHIIAAVAALGIYLGLLFGYGVAGADIPRHALYLMELTPDKFVHPQPDPDGQWVLYDNVQPAIDAAVAEALANCGDMGATGPWTTTPPAQDETQLLCDVGPGQYAFRDYINGQWRVGSKTGPAPRAWAKINAREVEWTG